MTRPHHVVVKDAPPNAESPPDKRGYAFQPPASEGYRRSGSMNLLQRVFCSLYTGLFVDAQHNGCAGALVRWCAGALELGTLKSLVCNN